MRTYKLRILMLLLASIPGARAERKYVIGTQIATSSGATNQIGNSGFVFSQTQKGLALFYGVYPSLNLKATDSRSELDLSYSLYGEGFRADQQLTLISHSVLTSFSSQLGERVRVNLSGNFYNMPDYAAHNVFMGIAPTQEGFQFLYEPLLAQRTSTSLTGGGSLDFVLNSKSHLTLGLHSYYRSYEKSEAFAGRLSDQLRIQGDVGYSHKVGKRSTWTLKYSAVENRYVEFSNARTQSATLGYSSQFLPSLSISLEAGPSWVEGSSLNQDHLGYLASFNLSQTIRANRFSFFYSHSSADTTGYGSISETQSAGLGFSRSLGRRLSVNGNVTAFDGRRTLDNPYNSRGLASALSISYSLTERLFMSVGGSYRLYRQVQPLEPEYKRIYLSLSYRAPELWRFSR